MKDNWHIRRGMGCIFLVWQFGEVGVVQISLLPLVSYLQKREFSVTKLDN